MSNTALDTISHHPSISLYHPTPLCCLFPFLPPSCAPLFLSLHSLVCNHFHPSIHPTSRTSIYPSALTRKLGLLSKTACVCMSVCVMPCVYGATGIAFQAGSFALAVLLFLPTISISVRISMRHSYHSGWVDFLLFDRYLSDFSVFNARLNIKCCSVPAAPGLMQFHFMNSFTSSVISEPQHSDSISRAASESTVMTPSSGLSLHHVTAQSVC